MRTAHALSPAARACAHSSGAWQPTRRSASLRHGPGRRNSLRQAPGLPRELPRDCPPRSPRTRINAPASDRLSRSALTTRTTASALRQRSSRDCSVQKGSFLSARAPAPAPPLKRPPPAATLRCSDRRGAPTRAATPRLLQWTISDSAMLSAAMRSGAVASRQKQPCWLRADAGVALSRARSFWLAGPACRANETTGGSSRVVWWRMGAVSARCATCRAPRATPQ
jgi:hypothetical protein